MASAGNKTVSRIKEKGKSIIRRGFTEEDEDVLP